MRAREQSTSRLTGRSTQSTQSRQAGAAHAEVYDQDILGLRPAHWEGSVRVEGHKLYGFSSKLSLASHITPSHINPLDFRQLARPTHRYPRNKDAAFARSEATTGWDFATTLNPRLLKQHMSHSLASSIKNSKDHTTALKNYRTPAENAAAVADKIKAARLETVQQVAALQAKFGKEGAAEMMRVAGMHTRHINRGRKASKYDLEAVAELDDLPERLSSDSA